MNRTLMRAVLDAAAFLELADDETLDPDTAVEQMEQLAATLAELTPEERAELLSFAAESAAGARAAGDEERAEFLASFGESFGLDGGEGEGDDDDEDDEEDDD
ncbi:MAG TPA: hypothetical protein VF588_00535 [Pyrinomonadaceae bacterium]|jgi:hypothetical protein